VIVVFKVILDVTVKIAFFIDLMRFALLYTTVRRDVPNADRTYIRNVSNSNVSTRRHIPKESQVHNFVLFTYFFSAVFWHILPEFVLKRLIFRQYFWISPSRGSAQTRRPFLRRSDSVLGLDARSS